MKIGEQTIAFLAVNKNGDEVILDNAPARQGEIWTDERSAHDDEYFSVEDHNSAIVLPKGTIRRLIGRDLKWEDDPISLKSVIEELPRVDTKKMKDQSDIDRKNKEIYSLIIELGVTLADLNYQWPNKLRRKFEKVTSNFKKNNYYGY